MKPPFANLPKAVDNRFVFSPEVPLVGSTSQTSE